MQKYFDHNGNPYRSFSAMCLEYGKPVETVRWRLVNGWPLSEALTASVNPKRVAKQKSCTDHLGNCYDSRSAMCARYGISLSLFYYRIIHGWDLEQALTTKTRR